MNSWVQAARLHGFSWVQAARLQMFMPEHDIITRRDLPHWYVPGAAHFVTYRLYNSLPRKVLNDLQSQRDGLLRRKPGKGRTASQHRERVHKQLFAAYDSYLDRGGEADHLADPRVATIVRSNLYHHDGRKYQLLAYCIMSNHVHVLFVPKDVKTLQSSPPSDDVGELPDKTSPLASIMHSLKSYTAHEANRVLNRSGPFWQPESYDHWVRDEAELERIVDYIALNPVHAGLVKEAPDWHFSSCYDRLHKDGIATGWLV